MTQAALARQCGVNVSFISVLERDLNKPSVRLLFSIAEALHTTADWIETGKKGRGELFAAARFQLWPQATYMAANQVLVPRMDDPASAVPDDQAVRLAVRRAWESRHFCDFIGWSRSSEGKQAGKDMWSSVALETLVHRATARVQPFPEAWIEYAQSDNLFDRPMPETDDEGQHIHRYSSHVSMLASAPGECYEFDLQVSAHLYSALRLGPFGCDQNAYSKRLFRSAFVTAVFPAILWSASRAWSDRRLAGWFSWLAMPLDLYGPLVRLARQYTEVAQFRSSATRLFDQVAVADADAFLGIFVDLYANGPFYQSRFGERPESGGPVVDGLDTIPPGIWPVSRRRRSRECLPDELLLKAIHAAGDPKTRTEVSEFLASKAPPHDFTDDDILKLRGRGRRKPRRRKSPSQDYPETLP